VYDLFGVSVHIIVTQDHITLKGIDAFIGIVLDMRNWCKKICEH